MAEDPEVLCGKISLLEGEKIGMKIMEKRLMKQGRRAKSFWLERYGQERRRIRKHSNLFYPEYGVW